MKLIAPDYYGGFKCIAAACRHSCCVGWEIDIDEETLAGYDAAEGSFGERLRASIERTDEGAHFRMDETERCPFLNETGLCDLIIEMGEDRLCEICADHPRFRNFLSDRTEIGLGLCCEAAGKLILSRKEKTRLEVIEDDGADEELWEDEIAALEMRGRVFSVLQDRSKPVSERLRDMLESCGASAPDLTWEKVGEILSGLERLDPAWDGYIAMLSDDEHAADLSGEAWETAFEQLAVYFAYRHFIGVSEDGNLSGRAGLIALSTAIIRRMCERLSFSREVFGFDDLVEIARMYSSEIEYSEENLDALTAVFGDLE